MKLLQNTSVSGVRTALTHAFESPEVLGVTGIRRQGLYDTCTWSVRRAGYVPPSSSREIGGNSHPFALRSCDRNDVATAKQSMDMNHLQLENLLYERDYLSRETQLCQDFT